MITWTFEGSNTFYKSKPENHDRDISKMALANKIDPETKIEIIDGDTNHSLPTDAVSSNGDTSTTTQSAISVDTEDNTSAEQEAVQLPPVFSDVDNAHIDPELLDLLDTFSDTIEPGDWFDNQRA